MAVCTPSHSGPRVPGNGACCTALATAGVVPVVGLRLQAVDKSGHCFVCQIAQSTSTKHPNQLVFRRGKSHVAGSQISCPTSAIGCCALIGA
jgi:hypothetical protein